VHANLAPDEWRLIGRANGTLPACGVDYRHGNSLLILAGVRNLHASRAWLVQVRTWAEHEAGAAADSEW